MMARAHECYERYAVRQMRSRRLVFPGILAATASLMCANASAIAEQGGREIDDAAGSQQQDAGQNPKYNGGDLTRPENSLDLRFRNRESSGETSQTSRNYWIIRGTSRIKLDPDWKLSLLA